MLGSRARISLGEGGVNWISDSRPRWQIVTALSRTVGRACIFCAHMSNPLQHLATKQTTVAVIYRLTVVALLTSVPGSWAGAQTPDEEVRVSLVYTGRSLGALGVLRAQEEHELLTEQANAEGLPFRLVSHACWRAPGVSIFMPTDEPVGDELPALIAARATAERTDSWPALRSNNVLLVQDPWLGLQLDLLEFLQRNPRSAISFPDLVETRVSLLQMNAPPRAANQSSS